MEAVVWVFYDAARVDTPYEWGDSRTHVMYVRSSRCRLKDALRTLALRRNFIPASTKQAIPEPTRPARRQHFIDDVIIVTSKLPT